MAAVINPNQPNYPLATLYVGDLDSDVTEAQLYERFSASGPVLSIRVCRDQITKHSLGYAYVNFQQPADAERALDTMNFDQISGKPMRIMWSQRDPALRKSGVGNVFIKNLDKSIDNKALYDTFSTFGNILSCKIMVDENAESKGFGFVHFELQEAADQAIAKVNGMMLNNKQVYVGKFLPKGLRSDSGPMTLKKYTDVFVKNFDDKLDDEKLRELFSKFGEITSAVAAKDGSGKSKGYGFVNFKDAISAADAVREMHEFQLGERKLFVGPFQKKAIRTAELKRRYEERKREKAAKFQGVNLYIKNLDDKIDDEELRKQFVMFGNITSAKVMCDSEKRSKGFGFVCFSTPEEAAKAVSEMRGRIVGTKPLYVALAQRKEDRRNQLVNQYKHRVSSMRMPNQQVYAGQSQMFMQAAFPNTANMYPPQMYQAARPTPRWAPLQQRAQNPSAAFQSYQMVNQQQTRRMPMAANQQMGQIQNQVNRSAFNGGQSGAMNPSQYMRAQNPMYVNGAPAYMQQQQGRNKKNAQMRDQPSVPNQMVNMNAPMQQSINVPGQEPLTSNMLAAAQPQEQKQMLGERLYPLIYNMYPDLAGKITGMLLEIDNAELLHMLDSQESLKEKVEEAVSVLKAHQTKAQ